MRIHPIAAFRLSVCRVTDSKTTVLRERGVQITEREEETVRREREDRMAVSEEETVPRERGAQITDQEEGTALREREDRMVVSEEETVPRERGVQITEREEETVRREREDRMAVSEEEIVLRERGAQIAVREEETVLRATVSSPAGATETEIISAASTKIVRAGRAILQFRRLQSKGRRPRETKEKAKTIIRRRTTGTTMRE